MVLLFLLLGGHLLEVLFLVVVLCLLGVLGPHRQDCLGHQDPYMDDIGWLHPHLPESLENLAGSQ